MPKSSSDPRAGIRMTMVLTALSEADDFQSLSEIAALTSLPPSTVHRLLEQLAEVGWVARGANRSYGVGPELSRVGALASSRLDIIEVAKPFMQMVVADCNETCMLGLYMPNTMQMTVVAKVDSKYPLKYRPRLNVHRTLLWGASGQAILAWLPAVTVALLCRDAPPSPADPSRRLDCDALQEELALIRARGYAATSGQRTAGAVGIAVPILGGKHSVIGDLCLTIPEFRYHAHDLPRYVKLLNEAVSSTARALGKQRRWR